MITLEVKERPAKAGLDALRINGAIPAVFYGRKEESTPISLSMKDFKKAWDEAGESSVLILKGVGQDKEVIIHDVAVHPVSGEPLHVDFYVIEKGKKIEVSVPLEFVGESNAVKELGGTLVKVIFELEIEAFPKDLPQEIEVDISAITDFDIHICAKDIALPNGVDLITSPDEVVALVSEPREEEPEEPAVEEFDPEKIEVEQKGKKEEDKEGAEEKEAKSE
jgi:large subunit ribosomal protein L25